MSLLTLEIPEATERELLRLSQRSGKDLPSVIAELVSDSVLAEEFEAVLSEASTDGDQEYSDASAGIQRGLDDFAAGRYRSFAAYAAEVRAKYRLQTEPR